MPDSIIIEILTKQDCFLCDEVKDVVTRVLPDYPVRLIMTNIESDSKLFDQFKEKIPVVRINGEESFIYKAHETTLRRKLDKILEKK
ncbi:MAG: glutaredoxin family protein [Nitrospinaceae bacterium]|jgi:glutaredoxin|nr:glutaredoxin family protein [Nitrospinaceae bacterium]|tara:strand:+ start:315 stop:575 length:261 start_codon:yes stop_codon:yes gene_type:complete